MEIFFTKTKIKVSISTEKKKKNPFMPKCLIKAREASLRRYK